MRIVLDLQGCQNASRFRGIGRYSLSLAREMVRIGGDRHEFHILLNRNLPEGLPGVASAFDDLLHRSHLHVIELPQPSAELVTENLWRTRAAELIREAALQALEPDMVHIASLFEGYGDNCVSSVGALGRAIPTAVTLYDLIPLLRADEYLADAGTRRWYYRKAQFAKRADLLLAISGSSAAEAYAALDHPPGRVVTIGTGVDEKFRPAMVDAVEEAALRRRYRLEKPFVMYAGAADPRKNLHGLVEGFAQLPASVRGSHCVAIIGKMDPDDVARIKGYAAAAGLAAEALVFAGFISDDDLIRLYSLCAALVFPSFHEGFGLPAAEAMACGAPVIGSDRTSIPEVIGRADALFDPADPASIAERLLRVLTDPAFRDDLRRHGPVQASRFTWTNAAELGLAAFERLHNERHPLRRLQPAPQRMPRIAFVSPLTPDLDAVAGYAARLLPCLASVFDVTCIADQPATTDAWLDATMPIRPQAWLRANGDQFDHVLYSLADSILTPALLDLMRAYPGTVLLHDPTLSSVLTRMRAKQAMQLLYAGHGWHAALFARSHGLPAAARRFDCLLPLLADAEVVVTHSPACARHVGERLRASGPEVLCIPPPSGPRPRLSREEARAGDLELSPAAFVVCSAVLGDIGMQRLLLDSWLARISVDAADMLLFVCGSVASDIEAAVADDITRFSDSRVRLLRGPDAMRQALAASDLVVQIGTLCGADAAMLLADLLRAGVPVLSADATIRDALPVDAVAVLPPDADAITIAEALDRLRTDPERRSRMAAALHVRAMDGLTSEPIEECVRTALAANTQRAVQATGRALRRKLAELQQPHTPEDRAMADAAMRANRRPAGPARLFIDISVLSIHDARSGIQRVSRSILAEMIALPPTGYRVEPIRWCDGTYRYARDYVQGLFGLDPVAPRDEPVSGASGDVYLCVDLIMEMISDARPWLEAQRLRGMRTVFVVYDLLPARRPGMFPPAIGPLYRDWITHVLELADGVAGISQAVMHELLDWLREHPPLRSQPLRLGWFHLGGDLAASLPSSGISADAQLVSHAFRKRETFLSVGTLEPRKGYGQALDAFEALWAQGLDVNYAIVGGRGWLDDASFQRFEEHPERDRRLFWFHGVSDEMLVEIYRQATAYLAVSEAEGFGLPLVEAAKFGLPIIARDIPVFREVTAGHASFFDTLSGSELAAYLASWLPRHAAYEVAGSAGMPSYTWRASAERLTEVVIDGRWSMTWEPVAAARKSILRPHGADLVA